MEQELLKLISIFLLSMVKFIAGPTLGYAANYSYLSTVVLTVAAMMTSVFIFTYLGQFLRERIIVRYFGKRKKFSKRSRRFVKIWKAYGAFGVAVLTPLIFTPIGGTLMLASTGTRKHKIFIFMLLSGFFWSFVLTGLVYLFGDTLLQYIL